MRGLRLLWTTIIQNSQFKKKVSLEEQTARKEDRFLRGRQISFMIYDFFRVTGAHDTVLDYADLLSVALHEDNVQEFDTRWDKVQLCPTALCVMKKETSSDECAMVFGLRSFLSVVVF